MKKLVILASFALLIAGMSYATDEAKPAACDSHTSAVAVKAHKAKHDKATTAPHQMKDKCEEKAETK
ncbi:MAG: hypothetical protein WCK47_13545 [bacterium]